MAGDVVSLVVNWSTPGDLVDCVTSADFFEDDLRWVVWQNHHSSISSEFALETINNRLNSRVRTHQGLQNLGHGWGINLAAETAQDVWHPKYFFIVNPDVQWREPVLDRMIDFLEEDENRCIVGPKQLDSAKRITAAGIVGTNEKPQHRDWHRPDPKNQLHRDSVPVTVVAGSAMLIRAKDFFDFGGLLKAAHYYSETWLCYHVRAHGRECWYYGEPWMIHEWHRSSPVGFAETDGRMQEDRALFRQMCDEHVPPIARD